jgi:hypothetical protein
MRSVDMVTAKCPNDGKPLEYRLEYGALRFGYTYAAGSLHFAPMIDCPCEGLEVERGNELTIRYGEREWIVRAK